MNKKIISYVLFYCLGLGFISVVNASTLTPTDQTQFSPYVDFTLKVDWSKPIPEPQNLIKISEDSGVKNFHLAFITDSGNCQSAWGGLTMFTVESKWASQFMDNLRNHGIGYIISFGGANGIDISHNCSQQQLTNVYQQVVDTYHPQGLDFDIENGSVNDDDINKIMLSLKQIQSLHPDLRISFTLPVLPEGLNYQGEQIITKAKNSQLRFTVNIMAMDYGPYYSNDMGQYAIQAATSVKKFLQTLYPSVADVTLWHMIEITPMIGLNDTVPEQFTLQDADLVRQFVNEMNLGGLSMWSIARDFPCANSYVSNECSSKNLQQVPYEFSKHFMRISS